MMQYYSGFEDPTVMRQCSGLALIKNPE